MIAEDKGNMVSASSYSKKKSQIFFHNTSVPESKLCDKCNALLSLVSCVHLAEIALEPNHPDTTPR